MDSRLLNTHDLAGTRVYRRCPRKAEPEALKKLGKVHGCVFHPTEARCVGLLVKRPDAALMFKRGDAFAALAGCTWVEGGVVVGDDDAGTGRGAEKALGVSLDDCVLWAGMPLMAEDGTVLGTVGSVSFDAPTGAVVEVQASQGATANALLGRRVVSAESILGFRKIPLESFPGAILIKGDAESALSGGAAEAAGKATAVVTSKAKRAAATAAPKAQKAADAAGAAASKAAFATGRQLGRATGMFAAFKEEYDKARNGDDED